MICRFNNIDLLKDVCYDDNEGVSKVEQQPPLNWLDGVGSWEGGRNREVDRGQDHHAGDVHRVDHVVSETRKIFVNELPTYFLTFLESLEM